MKGFVFLSLLGVILMSNTCNTTESTRRCGTEGKVIDMTGLDGCGLLIELKDGKRLEVFSIPEGAEALKAGDVIRFDFTTVDAASICMAGEMVAINCLEYLESAAGECFPYELAKGNELQTAVAPSFNLLESRTEGTNLYVKVGVSGCNDDRNFRLILSMAQTRSMPPQNAAVLSFTEQACEAYFEKELCFDMVALNGTTVLNIKNGKETERVIYEPATTDR